jgi:hypothetical protein
VCSDMVLNLGCLPSELPVTRQGTGAYHTSGYSAAQQVASSIRNYDLAGVRYELRRCGKSLVLQQRRPVRHQREGRVRLLWIVSDDEALSVWRDIE